MFGRLRLPSHDQEGKSGSVQDNRNDLRSFNDPAASVRILNAIEERNFAACLLPLVPSEALRKAQVT
jgi:hypothetical protein